MKKRNSMLLALMTLSGYVIAAQISGPVALRIEDNRTKGQKILRAYDVIDVDFSDKKDVTVLDLKKVIAEKHNIPYKQIIIAFPEGILPDKKVITDLFRPLGKDHLLQEMLIEHGVLQKDENVFYVLSLLNKVIITD